MKIKVEYIVLVLVIAGLSAYLVMRNTDKINYQMPDVPAVAKQDITKIEITDPTETRVLARKGGDWVIDAPEYPADSDTVDKMLESIADLTLTALVSETKNYDRYDLLKDGKITVKAWAGDAAKREFDVGKAAETFRHTFVKMSTDDRVFHARDNIRSRFDKKLDALRNKTVLSFNTDTITEIRFTDHQETSGKSMEIRRKQPAKPADTDKEASAGAAAPAFWEKSDGARVDSPKINGLLGTLSNLRCETYMVNDTKEAYQNPIYTFSLKGAEDYHLSIFKPKDPEGENYPAVSSQNTYVFTIAGWEMDGLLDKLDAKPEEPKQEEATPEAPKAEEPGAE